MNHILQEVTFRFHTSLQNSEKPAVHLRLHELVDLMLHIWVNQYVPDLSLYYPHMAVAAQHLPIQLYES